jgi:hypothetical protein
MPDNCWQHELFQQENIFTILFDYVIKFPNRAPRYLHMMPQVGTIGQPTLRQPKAKYNLEYPSGGRLE